MLSVDKLTGGYGQIDVLREVDLKARDGEIVAVIGANGAGKSTLLKMIAGFVATKGGSIHLDEQDLAGRPVHRRVADGVCLVPEGRQIWSALTVEEHLRLGWFATRHDAAAYRESLEMVYALFPILAERRRQFGGTLSGGEQQMLAIGRALILQPRALLLDEPTLGLAPLVMDHMIDSLRAMRSAGRTIIVAEQNAHFVLALADRGYVLETGSVRMTGDSSELLSNPELIASYLGEETGGI
jgi:branched-chain amino acid transport system ATP-binding protein